MEYKIKMEGLLIYKLQKYCLGNKHILYPESHLKFVTLRIESYTLSKIFVSTKFCIWRSYSSINPNENRKDVFHTELLFVKA